MSPLSAATASASSPAVARASASNAEKSASSPQGRGEDSAPTSGAGRAPKPRSCVVCRSRKVRCDKQSPCSNCRRANIACIVPCKDRPPRWARRLAQPATEDVMERLRALENLVRDLSGQLEQANARANSVTGSSTHDRDVSPQATVSPTDSVNVQKPFGRLVLQDANQSRYLGSSFWSRVNDELDELTMDNGSRPDDELDTSDEEEWAFGKSPSTQELERTPEDRSAFIFRHNLMPSTPDLREFHPLPSQIPFLLDIFSENVNMFMQAVHKPTITKMIRELRGDMTGLTPANEALMFSIYYAAVTSMEEEDVVMNFGSTKAELNLKYRLGLEHALAKADFLNVPDLVLIQALANFLALARRHDSPRFIWMMVGLAIRMAISLGLHRDGSNFEHLSPFEIEMRRRVWWGLCLIDVRASEDQGTDFTIAVGSFDTKIPLNIDDGDIGPESKQMPPEREGLSDMSIARVIIKTCELSKEMLIRGPNAPSLEEQDNMLQKIYQELDEGFLRYSTESNVEYWVIVTVARLMIAKMTLFVYLPVLFSSPSEQLTQQLRTKLLVAALEVAEHNHALNAEQACRQWRWIFQTYTHWHAIIYILIEISRRPWSPLVERAWMSLYSVWLIPPQSKMKSLRVWFPLRKLMAKGAKHRNAELARLSRNPSATEQLEVEYRNMPAPSNPGLFTAESNAADVFLEQWKQLLQSPTGNSPLSSSVSVPSVVDNQPRLATSGRLSGGFSIMDSNSSSMSMSNTQSWDFEHGLSPQPVTTITNFGLSTTMNAPAPRSSGSSNDPIIPTTVPEISGSQFPNQPAEGVDIPCLWTNNLSDNLDLGAFDNGMDLDNDIDWYNWVESAKGMEWDRDSSGNV
ncbi:uncharacterized protein N7482_009617 [Penicillium canariense]|uniref:Zn(2)-C6 fungal-type domain-containing protein n=1 Tax=Penicillium canariense TaxID=189055 RepID=A0A9W9HQR9_9EURO|nr:uncharacterized protein N7482_009617 [Penicillium canariense]KAJ5153139.1 hypothetical protein N7482_009617 [Penicillium canariense]